MKKENVKDEQYVDPYKVDMLSKIPSWLVILILKYWAAAAAVFFSVIGGPDIGLNFDDITTQDPIAILSTSFALVLFIGLFLALFMNYIIRPIVRLMHNRRNNTFRYNMINLKGFKSFLLSVIYFLFVSVILYFIIIFMGSHGLVFDPFGTSGGVGIEPFSYGLYFIVIDTLFVLIKNLIYIIYERIKYNKQIRGE